jgi:hypothetical protein
MDVKDYSQQLNQVKERYQDAAKDLRTSSERDTNNIKETSDLKLKKQSDVYSNEKQKMEEAASKNNEFYTEKTRDTIAKRQDEYRKQMTASTSKFDQEKNDMKQKYHDKLSDVTNTYQTSANENNRLHDQSKRLMNERFLKTSGEMQGDYNSKINKFSENAEKSVDAEKISDHEQRKELETNYRQELGDLRGKAQEKNFKEVGRLSEDNEKLRTNFERERESANEQKEARINDILKIKNQESKEGQQSFIDLRNKISAKEAQEQEKTREMNAKEAKSLDRKYNEDLKSIQRLANQKINGNGEVEGLQADNKRLRSVYENRIQSLGKNIAEDTVRMNEKENQNIVATKEQLSALKTKYNEERESSDRDRDHDKKKEIQNLNEKNTAAIDRYKDGAQMQAKSSENHLEKSTNDSKSRFKEQRIEFGHVVNKINEKNIENMSTLKDDFAKDKTQIQVKNQIELSEEKRNLRDKLQQSLSERDNSNSLKIEEMKKETIKIANTYEAKLEQLARQNEKEVNMLKANNEERKYKQDQMAAIALDTNKQEHQLEVQNLRSRYEKMIEKDRVIGQQQTNRIIQGYEDQLERERLGHQKELSLRTNEAQTQFERWVKGSELEKETIRTQYEDRIDHMKLSSLEQVSSKKA